MIEIDEFVERLCQLGGRRGPRRFPRKVRDREILMKSIRMTLDAARQYSEQEINTLLEAWRNEIAPEIDIDFVTLRRLLVDYEELERTRDGARYRVGFPRHPIAFDLEIDGLDLRATVAAYRMDKARRRDARKRSRGG
jgi:hypothetical protein